MVNVVIAVCGQGSQAGYKGEKERSIPFISLGFLTVAAMSSANDLGS